MPQPYTKTCPKPRLAATCPGLRPSPGCPRRGCGERRPVRRGSIRMALLLALLTAGSAVAQNLITQDGWEGFAMRDSDNKFDRCVLYNRTVEALTASPYGMLGITRDAAGHI